MRAAMSILLALTVCVAVVSCTPQATDTKTVDLLAQGLDGWDAFLEEGKKKEDVWSLQDGVLVCKGEPLGCLYTKAKYTSFRMELEWRWEGEPGNNGVLLRINGDPRAIPRCIEAQLKSGSAGDLYGFHDMAIDGAEDRTKRTVDHATLKDLIGDFTGVTKIKAAENPAGEWNKYAITLSGGDLKVEVNGQLVNEAHDCEVVAGPIGVQSEGGVIHIRNMKVTPTE